MEVTKTEVVLDALKWRYATKKFDVGRTIPEETWSALEESMVLTPSSYGLQPWQFLVVTDADVRRSLVPHSWNQPQPADCSHFVVFAAKTSVDEAFVDRFIARTAEIRGISPGVLGAYRNLMVGDLVRGARAAQVAEWAARQAYLALGQFMASAALVGIDTCPMEGIVPAEYDRLLGLEGSGFTTVVACAAGYRAEADKYARAPKVRYPASEVVRRI